MGRNAAGNTTKTTASQHVAEFLRQNIASKTWAVGERILSENELAKRLGVSRVSVRLAIQKFITLGVLSSVHGKGTFLNTDDLQVVDNDLDAITREDCRDVAKGLQFRLLLEPEACFLAASQNDAQLVSRLAGHVNSLVGNIGDLEGFVRHDLAFHIEISQACGNPLIYKALRDIFNQTLRDHQRMTDIMGFKDGVYYHSIVLKAFERNDPKLAKRLMTEHLTQALELFERPGGSPKT